jgi:hypothetical protein
LIVSCSSFNQPKSSHQLFNSNYAMYETLSKMVSIDLINTSQIGLANLV